MATYLCSRCGKPGVPDVKTMLDSRYTTGQCTGDHIERQVLVREDVFPTERQKKKRSQLMGNRAAFPAVGRWGVYSFLLANG